MNQKIMTLSLGRTAAVLLLLLPAQFLQAKTITVPLNIDFPLLRQLVVTQLFKGESVSAELLHDPNGCSEIVLSDPKLSEFNRHLQINSRLSAKMAVKLLDRCVPLLTWDGYVQIISDPVIKEDNPRLIYLQVLDSHLTSLDNEPLTSGALWDQARKHIHPLFKRFRLDLGPSINELKTFLPLLLPGHSHAQLNDMLASLHLANMQVTPDGIRSELVFDVATIAQTKIPEHALTVQEQLQWQQKWQSMDALLTHTIKHYAATIELKELKLTLFDILLDARYRLQEALQQDQTDDPVRHWFINSWAQLIPVLKQISSENPEHATLALMTLITATDALQTMDKLGPTLGLDISIDGLRRLARMLNHAADGDPLKYDEALDPELLRLFQFNPGNDHRSQPVLDFWPISSAIAANNRSLDNWIPVTQELDDYLLRVRELLLNKANKSAAKSTLTSQHQDLFRKLVMTTAWQESCWRQYVVEQKKIVPLRSSTGDTGIMQVNEKVWRGFVDLHKLRWNIAYNVQSGSNILLNYMTHYAIKKAEHKQRGGMDNLARATYSAYNGGPGQISRYRNSKAATEYRKIDTAFHDKFLTVKQGRELTVAECLGQSKVKKTGILTQKKAVNPAKKPQQPVAAAKKNLIHNEAWIKQQSKSHFTLQLGVFSSRQAATKFIRQQDITGNYAVYQQRKNRQSHYAVIYGRYSTRQRAGNEGIRFKQSNPWIRPFKDIWGLMNL